MPPAPVPGGAAAAPARFGRVAAGSLEGMRPLAGGEFLMGTDGGYGFAADGEGPAHAVQLAAFALDATAVTNEQFNAFVHATGYRTDSERYGWSFVFEGLLDGPAARRRGARRRAGQRVVVPGRRGELAPPGGARHDDQAALEPPGRPGILERRRGLCGLGGQAPADGSRMGVRRAGGWCKGAFRGAMTWNRTAATG